MERTWPISTWSFWLGIWSTLSKERQEQLIILIKDDRRQENAK